MSPRPLPSSRGGPSPRSRWTVPCLVPRGTRSRLEPWSVGTSITAPRIASGIVSGTSTSRFSPAGLNTGDSATRVITYRSPGGPASPPTRMPGSPFPASLIRLPSRTPAGTLTRRRRTLRGAPEPPQGGQGSSITVPEPPQLEQGCEIEKIPWLCDSTPRPLQTGHTLGCVPGLAPVPWQVGQGCEVGTASGTCAPSIACSKVSETSVSRSRPRCSRARPPRPPAPPARPPVAVPAPPPNKFERMSPKPPVNEPGSKPPGVANPKGPVPRSY